MPALKRISVFPLKISFIILRELPEILLTKSGCSSRSASNAMALWTAAALFASSHIC